MPQTLISCRVANADIQRKTRQWALWECDDPTFSYHYDQTVSFLVKSGRATLTMQDQQTTEIRQGDFVTIWSGAAANWVIHEPICNAYCYHEN